MIPKLPAKHPVVQIPAILPRTDTKHSSPSLEPDTAVEAVPDAIAEASQDTARDEFPFALRHELRMLEERAPVVPPAEDVDHGWDVEETPGHLAAQPAPEMIFAPATEAAREAVPEAVPEPVAEAVPEPVIDETVEQTVDPMAAHEVVDQPYERIALGDAAPKRSPPRSPTRFRPLPPMRRRPHRGPRSTTTSWRSWRPVIRGGVVRCGGQQESRSREHSSSCQPRWSRLSTGQRSPSSHRRRRHHPPYM